MKYSTMRYRVAEENIADVRKAVRDFVYAVHEREPDTIIYEVYQESNAAWFRHTIGFASDDAQEYHSTTAHFKEFGNSVLKFCIEGPVFTDLALVATKANLEWLDQP